MFHFIEASQLRYLMTSCFFFHSVFVLAYTVPVIYETYQDPIDRNWDKFMNESKNHWNKILASIKEALKKIPQHLKHE